MDLLTTTIILQMVKLLLLILLPLARTTLSMSSATCDGCHCVPEPGEPCPFEHMPETNFSELIPLYRSLNHTNPFHLDTDCNVHENTTCSTKPPQELTEIEGAICAFCYEYNEASDTCPNSYFHKSFASQHDAEEEGCFMTHEGACGVCSSAQDLAMYMEGKALASLGISCSIEVLSSIEKGIKCYEEAGFTRACATMWAFDALSMRNVCLDPCWEKFNQDLPNNGDPPNCTLNECLACNEINFGPTFARVAGRTRRNSGLLSMVVRPCSQLIQLDHESPCKIEETYPPSPVATDPPSTSYSLVDSLTKGFAFVLTIVLAPF